LTGFDHEGVGWVGVWQHEMATEQQSQVMTQQQENALYQINAKMEEMTVLQHHSAQMLAETSHKIGSYLQFDKSGAPSQDGKIVLSVRAAHGLLHLDAHHPPSPYAVIAINQQVFMTAVAPDTRNPIWEKECVFDVPSKASRIVVSVLDRTILGSNRTVLLGKAHISLNLLTDTDIEDWHDLTTDEFGMVRQHAGSVRVKRRFVPTRAWAEYLKEREYQAALATIPNNLDSLSTQDQGHNANIFGLYIMVLKGEGLTSGVPLQNVKAFVQIDQATNFSESTKHNLGYDIAFGTSRDEVLSFLSLFPGNAMCLNFMFFHVFCSCVWGGGGVLTVKNIRFVGKMWMRGKNSRSTSPIRWFLSLALSRVSCGVCCGSVLNRRVVAVCACLDEWVNFGSKKIMSLSVFTPCLSALSLSA